MRSKRIAVLIMLLLCIPYQPLAWVLPGSAQPVTLKGYLMLVFEPGYTGTYDLYFLDCDSDAAPTLSVTGLPAIQSTTVSSFMSIGGVDGQYIPLDWGYHYWYVEVDGLVNIWTNEISITQFSHLETTNRQCPRLFP